MAAYFTLLVKYTGENAYTPEFGDYDRGCVVDEKADYDARDDVSQAMVLRTSDTQDSINRGVAAINDRETATKVIPTTACKVKKATIDDLR